MAQVLFNRANNLQDEEMFSDVYKKDLIEAMEMMVRRELHCLRVDPYAETILWRGLKRREARETADPILEEAMLYTSVVSIEMLSGMADIIDTVDM